MNTNSVRGQGSAAKNHLAAITRRLRLDRIVATAQWHCVRPFIRAVTYHDVPADCADAFERQLIELKEHFEPVTLDDVAALREGRWRARRPGLLLTFDDGLRSHAEVAAPLLEKHGFQGCFFVPPAFLSCPVDAQQDFAAKALILHEERSSRVAMTWDQARRLARLHVVGAHSLSHVRLSEGLGPERLREEVCGARESLEAALSQKVRTFAWVGGEEYSYSATAAEYIRAAGYDYAFMTNTAPITRSSPCHHLQRTHIEAWFSRELMHFQLCGMLDFYYWRKRRRVDAVTAQYARECARESSPRSRSSRW